MVRARGMHGACTGRGEGGKPWPVEGGWHEKWQAMKPAMIPSASGRDPVGNREELKVTVVDHRIAHTTMNTAIMWHAYPSTVPKWNSSWNPNTRGQGSGLRLA